MIISFIITALPQLMALILISYVAGRSLRQASYRSMLSQKTRPKRLTKQEVRKGFKGVVWNERLQIDVDSYEAAESTERRLMEMKYDFNAYDTGGRGAHFSVLRNTDPSHLLPLLDKQWVRKFFPEADLCIYTHLHPFRLEGTKHEKTGNVKRLVCENRGSSIQLPTNLEETYVSTDKTQRSQEARESVFNHFRLQCATTPAEKGERHQQLIKMLYIMKDELQVPLEHAAWWVGEWNKMLSDPKDDNDLQKAIKSIYG
jgi:hypothetical protein